MNKRILVAGLIFSGSALVITWIRKQQLAQMIDALNYEWKVTVPPTPFAQGAQFKRVNRDEQPVNEEPEASGIDKEVHAFLAHQLDEMVISAFAKEAKQIKKMQQKIGEQLTEPFKAIIDEIGKSFSEIPLPENDLSSMLQASNILGDHPQSEFKLPEPAVKKIFDIPVIGLDKEAGEIDPKSKSFQTLLTKALKKADKDPDYLLTLSGRTYGLGAKGVKNEDGSITYNAIDIKKLLKKATAI